MAKAKDRTQREIILKMSPHEAVALHVFLNNATLPDTEVQEVFQALDAVVEY